MSLSNKTIRCLKLRKCTLINARYQQFYLAFFSPLRFIQTFIPFPLIQYASLLNLWSNKSLAVRILAFLTIFISLLSACSPKANKDFLPYAFEEVTPPSAPDYSDEKNWAALPDRFDAADVLPTDTVKDGQANAQVDVFFIHPTTYIYKDSMWNASTEDFAINQRTDSAVLKNQASVFNGSGKIYAPRYRQAHLKSYYNVENGGRKAIYLAYTDVRRSFLYYMEHYNNGRPIIIASHSQGTTHATLLLQEFFDGKPLSDKLVAAYVPGMPMRVDSFENIPPCNAYDDIECFVSWCTFAKGYHPDVYDWWYKASITTNPITWKRDSTYSDVENHLGILYYDYTFKHAKTISVSPENGILWMKKPKVWFRWFLWKKNYHVADYNLYWLNIRENVRDRVNHYFEQQSEN